ncbi:Ig-like domain-containing protein [Dyadobacter subterraneus]|uniref:Tandem-95 repeat protein n=1 Tax=Dyadobacter subterraneus TaxID=2773304 RepID=A0ABR9W7G8_9BACT|nr:tandem-95 repeat protein [Dyadobacter subterraneus]MBE9461415.1 tandem-95 repeat protein [Dyadobacter subterraneus]
MIRMYRNFTITLLGLLLLTAVTNSALAQCDPRFSGANFYGTSSPSGIATILQGETAQLKFNFGVGPQPTCNSTAGNSPGGVTISIVFPAEYAPTSAAAISGPQASLYNWTYNAATRTLTGVNNAAIPVGGAALFTVNVVGNIVTPGAATPLTQLSWSSAATPPITNSATANDVASVGLNVDAKPPVTTPDAVTTPAGSPVTASILTNDTPGSASIDPSSVKLLDPATNTPVSSVTVPGQGTYTVNPAGTVTFTPVAGFTGPATPVSYTVADVNGVVSNSSTISVNVNAVPPTAVPDIVTTPAGTPVTVTVTTNDTPGSSPIDPTTVKLIDPNTGTPVTSVTVPGEGTYTVNPNGSITFTPDPGFDGPGTPVSYTVQEGNGNTSNPAPITVTVTATPPVAVPDVVTTPSGIPVTITTTTNDTPGSSPIDPTTVKLIDPNTGTPATSVTIPNEGTYTVNPDGTITFTPLVGFNGPTSTISYTVTDVNGNTSNPATITVNITPVPPVAVPDVATTTAGTPVVITVVSNDTPGSAPIDPQMVKLIDPVTGLKVLSVTVPNEGTYTVDINTGKVTFTPVAGFVGTTTPISYTDQDGAGSFSNPATITVTVTAVPPTATGDSGNSPNGTPVAVPVLNNDTPGSFSLDPTTVKLIDPNTGTPSTSVTIPNEGTYTVDPGTGVVTFTPDPALTTPITSTITYTVTDTHGNTSTPATITINATPLPVTLTVFKVSKEGQTARLNWATTAETNSDRFEIQHSVTGKDWHVIGSVNSHGESTVENKYNFTDNKPVLGSENLYRLKMIDKDATFAYSRIQSMKFEGSNGPAVSVYPNPSTDKVFVQDMDLSLVKQVAIIDMNGRTVFSSNTVSSNGINVSKLISGTYILHITNVNGMVSNHKIVIAK